MLEQIKDKLNTRQWKLYEYLKQCKGWKKRIEVLRDLKELYNYNEEDNLYYNKSAIELTKDIKAINSNGVIQKLIISNSKKGVKIPTEQEAIESLSKEHKQIMSKLKRYYGKLNKIKDNNQIRLIFNNERNYVESFIKE